MDERLRGIGGEMEAITRGRDDELAPQALVCDVFDLVSEGGAKQILEVGIGDVDELYVIVPRAGKQLLARGGAFSYYEFPSAERLDDAGFRALLDDGKAPRPAWAAPAGKAPPARQAPPPERRRTRD